MKKNHIHAILAALLLITTCTGCGSNADESFTNAELKMAAPEGAGAAPEAPAVFDGAAEEDNAYGGEVYDDAEYEYAAGDFGEVEEGADISVSIGDEAFAAADAPKADIPSPEVEAPPVEDEPKQSPAVGILTAGEWRDHDNWGFFSNLVNNGTISFPSFGIDPTQRIAVSVKGADGIPLPNAKVQLLSADNAVIWSSVTDKSGTAYVFEPNGQTGSSLYVVAPDGNTATAVPDTAQTDEQGGAKQASDRRTEVTVESSPVLYSNTQIMFIVDTTGSMGDEMLFLQSDFSAIVDETGGGNTSYAVSFYKDEGDSYVTRIGSFTTDANEIRTQLNNEIADGGGDEPEAVAEALSESFAIDGWADDSVKIAFLIYDAPPHSGKEAMLQSAIASASEKGIHLIPVVSSNGSRETELFGRAAAICTNGSYVFLTDHSGVGESHLEPIIGDYEVEKLHDIIVRIINNYKQ